MDKARPDRAAWLSRERRHSVKLEATVVRDGSEASSRVTDLSLDGCCLAGHFRIGEQLIVRIPPIGEFPAQVRWAMLGRAGVRFIRRHSTRQNPGLLRNTDGVAAIEYALLAGLIALTIIAAVTRTGDEVGNNWNEVEAAIPSGVNYQTR